MRRLFRAESFWKEMKNFRRERVFVLSFNKGFVFNSACE
jgi:hypothetical protein